MRLIDADALPYENQVLSLDDEWCLKIYDIDNAPTIDPSSLVKRGRWEWRGGIPRCTACESMAIGDPYDGEVYTTKYCPNCGANLEA